MEKLDEERINKENEIDNTKRIIDDYTSTINSLKDELNTKYAELCKIYAKYEPWNSLKGCKIEISEKNRNYVVKGFYKGEFEKDNYFNLYRPILYKIKKDGTASANRYTSFDVPSLNQIEYVQKI